MAYDGIFIRDFVGEKPDGNNKGKSWTNSPDILDNGPSPLPDPSILVIPANYDAGKPNLANQTPLTTNFVYVRGINTLSTPQTSTIYLYYVDTSIVLWPQNWKSLDIIRTNPPGIPLNAAQLTADPNGIVATIEPYRWTPARQGIHYCLVAWVKNGPDQLTPPDLYSIGTVNDMGNFILDHPNIGWKNTTEIDATQPTIENYSPIEGAEYGGVLNVGVQCENLPTDGWIEFYVPGPDKENTVIFPKTQIPFPNYGPTAQVRWPEKFNSAITFRYYKGKTDPPDGANIIPMVGSSNMGLDFIQMVERVAPSRLIETEFYASPAQMLNKHSGGVPPRKIFIVGSVPNKLITK